MLFLALLCLEIETVVTGMGCCLRNREAESLCGKKVVERGFLHVCDVHLLQLSKLPGID